MKLTVTVLSDCGTEQETRNMILVFVFCFRGRSRSNTALLNWKYCNNSEKQIQKVSTCFSQLSVLIPPEVNYLGILLKVRRPPSPYLSLHWRKVYYTLDMSAMVGPYNAVIDVPGGK